MKNAHQDPELPKNITIKGVEASKETSEEAFHGRIEERYSGLAGIMLLRVWDSDSSPGHCAESPIIDKGLKLVEWKRAV